MRGALYQFPRVPVAQVKDRQTRDALEALDAQLQGIRAFLREIIETDPKRGTVRVSGGVKPRELTYDPSTKVTQGRTGEIVTVKKPTESRRRFFVKQGNTGKDTDWRELLTAESAAAVDFYHQVDEPPVEEKPGLWWKILTNPNADEIWWRGRKGNDDWAWQFGFRFRAS